MTQHRGGPNPDEPSEAGEATGEPRPSGDVIVGKIVPKGGADEPQSAAGVQQGRVLTDADWNPAATQAPLADLAAPEEGEPSTLADLGATGPGPEEGQPEESDLGFLSQPATNNPDELDRLEDLDL